MRKVVGLLAVLLSLSAFPTTADVVTLTPDLDNTLYDEAGFLSNGLGQYIFVGVNKIGDIRRCLVRFDIAGSIPAGSTINSATLRGVCSRTVGPTKTVSMHRATGSWGEGTSDAPAEEGAGRIATTGDATWSHRFYDTIQWTTPGGGGDFLASPSATVSMAGTGPYVWSSPALAADVQLWLSAPATNHRWLLKMDDEVALKTAKRLDSRHHPVPASRPRLEVDFDPPPVSVAESIEAYSWGRVKARYHE